MKQLTITQRRWLIAAHILGVVVWLGTAVCFLVLSIIAAVATDSTLLHAVYVIMGMLDKSLNPVSPVVVLLTGVLLSLGTKWGLIRFYWIIVKEIGLLVSIGLGFFAQSAWVEKAVSLTAAAGLHVGRNPAHGVNHGMLIVGNVYQILALSALVVISVFKPWGQRKRTGTAAPRRRPEAVLN